MKREAYGLTGEKAPPSMHRGHACCCLSMTSFGSAVTSQNDDSSAVFALVEGRRTAFSIIVLQENGTSVEDYILCPVQFCCHVNER